MRTYTSIHFDSNESPAVEIRNGVDHNKIPYLVLDMVGINFFFEHWQLLEIRDKITKALSSSAAKCHFPECEEQRGTHQCLSCDRVGCDEHMRTIFCTSESNEVDGYECDPTCPAKAEVAA